MEPVDTVLPYLYIGPIVGLAIVGFHYFTRRKRQLNTLRRAFHIVSMVVVGAGIFWFADPVGWGPIVGPTKTFALCAAIVIAVGNALSIDFCDVCGRLYSTVLEPKFRICGACRSRRKQIDG